MIKGIMGGNGISVTGGSSSFPYVPMNSNNPIQGMIRVNGQDLQVFDGSSWINLSTSYVNVEFTGETQALLDWARTERNKQLARETLIKNNPALQKAYEAIKRAEANFELIEKFVENDKESEGVQSSP